MRLIAAALIGGVLLSGVLPAAAGDDWTLLNPRERRAYHDCMTEFLVTELVSLARVGISLSAMRPRQWRRHFPD